MFLPSGEKTGDNSLAGEETSGRDGPPATRTIEMSFCSNTFGVFWCAYAMAVESACGMQPSARALWLRALFLERERIANHLGDLGFLGNDAALGFGTVECGRAEAQYINRSFFGGARRLALTGSASKIGLGGATSVGFGESLCRAFAQDSFENSLDYRFAGPAE